jgi:hypothetical protein
MASPDSSRSATMSPGGFAPGIYEPSWLASPFAKLAVILTLDEAESGDCANAAQHPDLRELPATQQWVEVTGHWADGASASCRYRPDRRFPGGAAWISVPFACSTVFVLTEMTPAP